MFPVGSKERMGAGVVRRGGEWLAGWMGSLGMDRDRDVNGYRG